MLLESKEYSETVEDGIKYSEEIFQLGDYKVSVDTEEKEGRTVKFIDVYGSEEYLPTIYYRRYHFNERKNHFEIQTTSYGSLKAEEIEKVVIGYQQALEAVKILEMNFC